MSTERINIGSVANDGTGDALRDAGTKINAALDEIDVKDAAQDATLADHESRLDAAEGTITSQGATIIDHEARIDSIETSPATHGIPSGGTAGQVLTKSDGVDYHAEWVDPAAGGTHELPAAGSTGQLLAKNSATDYDVEWVDPPTGGGGGALPTGGTTGQVLTKNSATDGDASWLDPTGGGGGGGTGTIYMEFGPYAPPLASWFDFVNFKNAALTAAVTDSDGRGMAFSITGSNANDQLMLGVRSTATWGSDYKVRARIVPAAMQGAFPTFGLAFFNSGTGVSVAACSEGAGSSVTNWNIQLRNSAGGTFGANVQLANAGIVPYWFEVERVGATLYWRMSIDGTTWTEFSEPLSTHIVNATHVGIFVVANQSATVGNAQKIGGLVTYWDDPTYTAISRQSGLGGGSAVALTALSDYNNAVPATGGQTIRWNATSLKWEPWTPPTATRLKDRFSPPSVIPFATILGTNSTNPLITNKSDGTCVFDFGANPAAGDNNRMALKAISASTWEIVARLDVSLFDYDYNGGGLYLRNSATSKFLAWGATSGGTAGRIQMNRWTNQTTFDATPFSMTPTRNSRFEWFKITFDGTNYSFFVSIDGDSWIKCGQEGTGFVGVVDQVGLGMLISHVHTYPSRTQDGGSQAYPWTATSEGFVHCNYYSDPDIVP